MTKFTCVTTGFDSRPRTVERNAVNTAAAAEQCAKAMHANYWTEGWRAGTDSHGSYEEFAIKAGTRPVSTVRVYAEYR